MNSSEGFSKIMNAYTSAQILAFNFRSKFAIDAIDVKDYSFKIGELREQAAKVLSQMFDDI